jgi:hypothetical protein
MNKGLKVFLAVIGATDVVFSLMTPILLVWVWTEVFGVSAIFSHLLFLVDFVSCIYRAIIIGFLTEKN